MENTKHYLDDAIPRSQLNDIIVNVVYTRYLSINAMKFMCEDIFIDRDKFKSLFEKIVSEQMYLDIDQDEIFSMDEMTNIADAIGYGIVYQLLSPENIDRNYKSNLMEMETRFLQSKKKRYDIVDTNFLIYIIHELKKRFDNVGWV